MTPHPAKGKALGANRHTQRTSSHCLKLRTWGVFALCRCTPDIRHCSGRFPNSFPSLVRPLQPSFIIIAVSDEQEAIHSPDHPATAQNDTEIPRKRHSPPFTTPSSQSEFPPTRAGPSPDQCLQPQQSDTCHGDPADLVPSSRARFGGDRSVGFGVSTSLSAGKSRKA